MEPYSVLMSVYCKENPVHFNIAVQSMLDQTCPTDDFVIVCDGPLTEELDKLLEDYKTKYPGLFHIVRLPENVGIGAAADIGLRECKNDLVAKMDADDISVATRCEKQLERFEERPHLTVVGGLIEEFDKDPDEPIAIRDVPLSNAEIRRFARRRQPFNNPTVMYRRSAVLDVGGYRSMRRGEDYDLYIRLLNKGYEAENLNDVLVRFRVDTDARRRRTSFQTLQGFIHSRWNALTMGYSSLWDFVICCAGELFVFLCPSKLQDRIYIKFLRKSVHTTGDVERDV